MVAEAAHAFSKAGALQSSLRRLFTRSDRDSLDSGLKAGRLRVSALPRVATGADNVFARRTLTDGANSAVCLCIDGSGSMSTRTHAANRAAAMLVKALASCAGVRSKVVIFQEGGSNSTLNHLTDQVAQEMGVGSRYSDVTLSVLKDYSDAPAHGFANLASPYASGSTPDLEATAMVGAELAKRSEQRRVLLLLVDGGSGRDADMAREVANLKRRGVVTIAIGINYEPRGFEHSVAVYSLNDLGGAAFRKVCEVIARNAPQ